MGSEITKHYKKRENNHKKRAGNSYDNNSYKKRNKNRSDVCTICKKPGHDTSNCYHKPGNTKPHGNNKANGYHKAEKQ